MLFGWVTAPLGAQDLPPGSAVVTGRVVAEETSGPVATASVELRYVSDSLLVASALTDPSGRFRLARIPDGTFILSISSLGYGNVSTQPFEVAEAEVRDLGELRVPVEALRMEPITVSAQRTVVTYEGGSTIYNIGVMPGTEGASVTETLSRISELDVDIDGRITIRGEPVTIYINGRETPMAGEALAVFLEQFPADYLQAIEVMDNPGARYAAAGTGGIVDLVLKEGVDLGLSGSIFANAGTRGQYGAGGRGTLQRGDWTLNAGTFLRLSDQENTGFDLRQNLRADPAFLRQDTRSERSGLSNNVDLGLRYEPTEQARFHLGGRLSGSGNDAVGGTTTTHLDGLEDPILSYDRSRSSDSRSLSTDLSGGIDYVWERRRHEFELEVEWQRGDERSSSREEITEEAGFDAGGLLPAEITLEDDDSREDEVSVSADYIRPLGEETDLGVGYAFESAHGDNRRWLELVEGAGDVQEVVRTDQGNRERDIGHSVYATFGQGFGGLSAEAGLRAEFTDLRFRLPDGTRFGQSYTNLFPSFNLSYRMEGGRQLRLSHSRRVNRPGIRVLDPTNRSTDPLNRQVGNPDVDPQFTDRITAHLTWDLGDGTLRVSPHFSSTRNGWAEITTVDDQGISTRTWENLTSGTSYGASVHYSLRQRGGWRGDVGLSGRQEDRDASNLGQRYSGGIFMLAAEANLSGPVTEALSIEGNLSYEPAVDLPQGRRDPRYEADFGLRYRLMDDRGSVRLSLRDPFGLRRSSSTLRDVDYVLVGRSVESTRSAQLSVSWALGGSGEFRGGGRRR